MKKVFVGLSGGVDSSVATLLLKKQGYLVTGVYMKNWSQSLPGFDCPWKEDYQDAKRVAVQLGINFLVFDFEKQYKQKVVDYMLNEYRLGHTPNPDIMCNQEIKFKLFLEASLEGGADFVATGHYAKTDHGHLYKARDHKKDQTYFLYRVNSSALEKTLFPLGDYLKTEIREIAFKNNLVTKDKKESMGICFVGKVGIKDFLTNFVNTSPGPLIDQNGVEVGTHDGAIFYTIGQRHGLNVGGGLPYFVTSKDMATNTVYVTSQLDDEKLWSQNIKLVSSHYINSRPNKNQNYQVRVRHQGELLDAEINGSEVVLKDKVKALNSGQSVVIYDDEEVLGGGIISTTN